MRTHAANLVKKPDNTLTVMSRHDKMQCQHAGTIQDVGSPHVVRTVTLTAFAHDRLVIWRLEPALYTIRPDQKHIIIRVDSVTTIERERFHPVRQFNKFGQLAHR